MRVVGRRVPACRGPPARGVSLRVTFHPAAAQEFEDAAAWLEGRRPGLGQAFLEAVRQTTHHLETWSDAGIVVRAATETAVIRRMLILRFPYAIIYQRSTTSFASSPRPTYIGGPATGDRGRAEPGRCTSGP